MKRERRVVIAGNWKMAKTQSEARVMVRELLSLFEDERPAAEVVLCPAFPLLPAVGIVTSGSLIQLGAQNVHWEEEGAFTGEVSVRMLLECGCRYVIVGHSERRHLFGETNEMIARRLSKAIRSNLTPILCVGERLEERQAGRVREVVEGQLEGAAGGLTREQASRMIVAYEPVWAIGTGETATPETAQEVHRMVRTWLAQRWSEALASSVRILYGGSVKPENARALLAQPDIDGALVGGASLEARSFARIVAEGG